VPRTSDEQELIARVSKRYELAQCTLLQEIERAVCGCDYGGTSWATRDEVLDIGRRLDLAPGKRLLEVGAGAGWPALFLAHRSGCDAALTDLPLAGLQAARARAAADRPSGACWVAVADGTALPFRRGWFDAASHSDVLCCLAEKMAVLNACHDAVRPGGRVVFSVILVAPGLSGAAYERAVAGGPPVVETAASYPTMLRQADWRLTDRVDLTDTFRASLRRMLDIEQARATELSELLGTDDVAAMLNRRRTMLGAVEDGLLRRQLYEAVRDDD